MKSCFFLGHREAPQKIAEYLEDAVERHITEYKVREFIVGGYGAFDAIAAGRLVKMKSRYPEIRLLYLTPYHPAERKPAFPEGFEACYYPEGMEKVPKPYAIARANRHTIGRCSHLIAFVWHPGSNARELYEYARSREKRGLIRIENLAAKLGHPDI